MKVVKSNGQQTGTVLGGYPNADFICIATNELKILVISYFEFKLKWRFEKELR